MNAQSHPQVIVIHGTINGVNSAPIFVPELKRPVANARSRFGNHSATTLIAAGKLPASPNPSAMRASMKPATDAEYVKPDQRKSACDRRAKHRRLGVRNRRQTPHDDGHGKAGAGAKLVDHPPRDQEADGIRQLKRKDDVAVVDLTPAKLLLKRRLEDPDHLPVDVVDRGSEEEERADHPPVAARPCDRGGGRVDVLVCWTPTGSEALVMAQSFFVIRQVQIVGLRR